MSAADDENLFDADFLERLKSLFFRLRRRRQLKHRGPQATRAAGFTRVFKDRRHYVAGDDVRTVDWRLFARHERLFVRVFEEIQEFHVHLVVDVSRSMNAPFSPKRTAALRTALALAYLALVNQHRVSLWSLGETVKRELPPLKGEGHVHELRRRLADLRFTESSDLVNALKRFRPTSAQRGLVFLLSDFLGRDPSRAGEALAHASHWPAETHVVHVLHPEEIRTPLVGDLKLVDTETGDARRVWITAREQRRYAEAVDRFLEEVRRGCTSRQMDYYRLSTDVPFDDALVEMLSRGNALADG